MQNINEVQTNLQEIDQIKENLKNNVEQVILKEAKAINTEYPEIIKMAWFQYTPSFNDGDLCTFSIGAVGFFDQKSIDEAEEEEGEINGYMIEEYDVTYDLPDGPLKDRLNKFSTLIHKLGDILGALYGTWGAQVHIDMKEGTLTVNEYDCGY